MAAGSEIRTQITSIKNTQKITKAMQMVASSKMRKTQARMAASRPYAEKMLQVIGHLSMAHPEYKHPFLVTRECKRVGLIVVSTDRGLCGGLNTNLFKACVTEMRQWQEQGKAEVDVCALGSKGSVFMRRIGANLVADAGHLGDVPVMADIIGTLKVMFDKYRDGEIDKLFIAANVFVNTMTQAPTVMQLLPLAQPEKPQVSDKLWDYIYEPEAAEVLDDLLLRYVESLVYQALVENVASEQAARMIAMRSATDNASDLMDELQLIYNKARQAAITQEISEIVGGAAAV